LYRAVTANNFLPYSAKVEELMEPYLHNAVDDDNNTGQQILTFFGTRGKISNPNRNFKAEFKCVSSFSPKPTVCL